MLNESEEILVLVDEAHRSHTRTLHRNLRKALPNAAIIGFTGTPILSQEKTETREIFGEFIDKYLLQDAELDGATVPILYEGRTADGLVKDAPGLDQLFEDMFRDYTPEELAVIKAKYATEGDVLEAPLLIEQKARDMLRHYVGVVLPEGFKAQVVATSRQAAVTYQEKLEQARQRTGGGTGGAAARARSRLPDDEVEKLDAKTRFLVRAHGELPKLRALEIAVVILRRPQRSGVVVGLDRQGQAGGAHQALQAQVGSGRRPTRPIRCRSWSSTTCCSPASTRRWSRCCTSTARSSRTTCCRPSPA